MSIILALLFGVIFAHDIDHHVSLSVYHGCTLESSRSCKIADNKIYTCSTAETCYNISASLIHNNYNKNNIFDTWVMWKFTKNSTDESFNTNNDSIYYEKNYKKNNTIVLVLMNGCNTEFNKCYHVVGRKDTVEIFYEPKDTYNYAFRMMNAYGNNTEYWIAMYLLYDVYG